MDASFDACNMTKVEAIRSVLKDNGGIATWEIIYNEIEKYYPTAKASNEWQAGIRGVLYREIRNHRNFKKIDDGTYSLADYDENKLVLPSNDLVTTKDVLAAIRIGQGEFRKKLLLSLKRCPITGVDDGRILTASHIKPWMMATNYERLDMNNGFLFSPTFDRLFDRGMITFTNDKALVISPTFSEKNVERLRLKLNRIIPDLPVHGREQYLEYHRSKIFLHQ